MPSLSRRTTILRNIGLKLKACDAAAVFITASQRIALLMNARQGEGDTIHLLLQACGEVFRPAQFDNRALYQSLEGPRLPGERTNQEMPVSGVDPQI